MPVVVKSVVSHLHDSLAPVRSDVVRYVLTSNEHSMKERLAPAELRIVIKELFSRDWVAPRIARHVGCCLRTVERHKRKLNL